MCGVLTWHELDLQDRIYRGSRLKNLASAPSGANAGEFGLLDLNHDYFNYDRPRLCLSFPGYRCAAAERSKRRHCRSFRWHRQPDRVWSAWIIFMLTSITLSIVASRKGGNGSVLQNYKTTPSKSQPAAPAQKK